MPDIVETRIDDPRWQDIGLSALAEQAAHAALEHLGFDPDGFEVSLLGCDDDAIAELNSEFRDKPSPTNVLSWPSEERRPDTPGDAPDPPEAFAPGMPVELGDIAIAWDTCVREASDGGKPLGDHVTHLIVHAVLHLLGYDHETDADALLMEGRETEILESMGLEDPYSVPGA